MTGRVLDGAAMAREIFSEVKPRVAELSRQGVRPGLATVLVGDNSASRVYVRNKVRACAEVGLHAEIHELAHDCGEKAVLAKVDALNRAESIHGIIVQLPLPRDVNPQRVLQSIAIEKDVDGFNWANLGALLDGE